MLNIAVVTNVCFQNSVVQGLTILTVLQTHFIINFTGVLQRCITIITKSESKVKTNVIQIDPVVVVKGVQLSYGGHLGAGAS